MPDGVLFCSPKPRNSALLLACLHVAALEHNGNKEECKHFWGASDRLEPELAASLVRYFFFLSSEFPSQAGRDVPISLLPRSGYPTMASPPSKKPRLKGPSGLKAASKAKKPHRPSEPFANPTRLFSNEFSLALRGDFVRGNTENSATEGARIHVGPFGPVLELKDLLATEVLDAARKDLLLRADDLEVKADSPSSYSFADLTDATVCRPNTPLAIIRDALYSSRFIHAVEDLTGIIIDPEAKPDVEARLYEKYDRVLVERVDVAEDKDGQGRRLAFFLSLAQTDSPEAGGALELFNMCARQLSSDVSLLLTPPRWACSDALGEPDQVKLRLEPGRNSLFLFEATPASFYEISEIIGDHSLPSIVGWFRGPLSHRLALRNFESYGPQSLLGKEEDEPDLAKLINQAYLDEEMVGEIQNLFADNSSVTLFKFFLPEVYDDILREAKKVEWSSGPVGPANVRRYHAASSSSQPTLHRLFRSSAFRDMLTKWTTLEPARSVRVNPRYFKPGCYTLLHDQAQDSPGLDVILGLNDGSSEWDDEWGGDMVWTASPNAAEEGEEEHDGDGNSADDPAARKASAGSSGDTVAKMEVEEKVTKGNGEGGSDEDDEQEDEDDPDAPLLTLAPTPNALTIALRDAQTLKYVRYVNAGAKRAPDQGRIDVEAVYLGDWFNDEEA
jgi:Rps23 Pro-64 3,4-dihydroxylase Tpa1-like proline 4-hydroxylase